MTLNEKIETAYNDNKRLIIQLHSITELFAMQFAEWCIENNICKSENDGLYHWGSTGNECDLYYLLQNFKIEKEL